MGKYLKISEKHCSYFKEFSDVDAKKQQNKFFKFYIENFYKK